MTTPYVTGTVSVTAGSAVVTGVGTGWLTSGLVAGQFGLDSANGNPVPVLSIDSDTQITLAKPWRGTSANAQGYWITYDTTPGQQTVANAQRLAEYIARLDKPLFSALSGLIPAVDKIPYFGAGGAGALADFNAAARALLAGGVLAESQIPGRLKASLPFSNDFNLCRETGFYYGGSTTLNIPVAPYSYVLYTIAVNANYFIQRAYTLGEIIQGRSSDYVRECSNGAFSAWVRAGRPERGSNANGDYVRFSDGTQICQMRRQFSGSGAGVRTQDITYPITFISKPQLLGAANYLASGFRYLGPTTGAEPGVSSATSVGIEVTNGGYGNLFCELRAEGRWY